MIAFLSILALNTLPGLELMQYFVPLTIGLGVMGLILAGFAAVAGLRRWSPIAGWKERAVSLSLIALLVSSVLSFVWFVSGIIIGGPVTAIAGLLWPPEATRDFDVGFIFFLPLNGAVGMSINFIFFPILYATTIFKFVPLLVRYIAAPIFSAISFLLIAQVRGTSAQVYEQPFVWFVFQAQIFLFWLVYLVIIDVVASRPGNKIG